MSSIDMRALYYVLLPIRNRDEDESRYSENMKANENNLNQNFLILTKKIEEMEARLSALEAYQDAYQ